MNVLIMKEIGPANICFEQRIEVDIFDAIYGHILDLLVYLNHTVNL